MSTLLDFVDAAVTSKKGGENVVFPVFNTVEHDDLLMVGGEPAIWDADNEVWTTDSHRWINLIDTVLKDAERESGEKCTVKGLADWYGGSRQLDEFYKYFNALRKTPSALDQKLTFKSDRRKRGDYCSRRLPFDLNDDEPKNYNRLMEVLYSDEERDKFEWFMGSIIAGEFPYIQKFIAITGDPGTGKSTLLNIVSEVLGDFDNGGYVSVFSAGQLTNKDMRFALAPFKDSPLVAIDQDADMSRINDNARFNSVVSHEKQVIELKGKPQYSQAVNTMLMVASNKDVLITDMQSGLIRRLIDISPTGEVLKPAEYHSCMSAIKFEKGAICNVWLRAYRAKGRYAYDRYIPTRMLVRTNDLHNFVLENYEELNHGGYAISSTRAFSMYADWCARTGVKYPLRSREFANQLESYFNMVYRDKKVPMSRVCPGEKRAYKMYDGLDLGKFKSKQAVSKVMTDSLPGWLNLSCSTSIFDEQYGDLKAQYAVHIGDDGHSTRPEGNWGSCKTTLSEIDTSKEHYVRVPQNMIIIDFDRTRADGKTKDKIANLWAASEFPPTYAEFSRSGEGLHLHYLYDGDVAELAKAYDTEGKVEILSFPKNKRKALRRRLTLCNDYPIATIRELPLAKDKPKKVKNGKVLDKHEFENEAHLRRHVENCLRRKYEPQHTKPNLDYILNALTKAYKSGMRYDLTDLSWDIFEFARSSSHQSQYCMELYNDEIKPLLKSKDPTEGAPDKKGGVLTFFDVEVFPNLFVVCFKKQGSPNVEHLINPTPEQVRMLTSQKLVGFNNRRYDNHILYAASLEGTEPEDLYEVSQRIINTRGKDGPNPFFGQAYDLAYADIYDFSSKKQSLKKFEIELGIHHQELDLPWDKPVREELWPKVVQYCENDVRATEATFNARHGDFVAREILAEISGLKVCNTTRQHATKIIFGENRHPQSEFIYTHLNEMFPGYEFDNGKSTYMGEVVGEGGYVYAEPGMYGDVTVLDVASMHPTSIIELNLFGDYYTEKFKEIVDLRLAIKHGDFKRARKMMDGKVAKYLDDESQASDLANALKIVINSIYGFTAARFECEFRDPRNVDNIVAKRGALFMINLKHEVQKRGYTVAHIKTDSIKIPNATPEIIKFVEDYGKEYGYTFEIENEFDRFCLVNDAVYIARHKDGKWDATGAEFQVPYVFKTLFSHEDLVFNDMCVTKSVSGNASIYLDLNEGLDEDIHCYKFVGRTGQFCPVKPDSGGGYLLRKPDGEEKYSALAGTKGWRWLESEEIKLLKGEGVVDVSYFEKMAEEAQESIEKYGDFSQFAKE